MMSRHVHIQNNGLAKIGRLDLVVATVGTVRQGECIPTRGFREDGDAIILLGEVVDLNDPSQGLTGSTYLKQVLGVATGTRPQCNLERERELQLALRALIYSGDIL